MSCEEHRNPPVLKRLAKKRDVVNLREYAEEIEVERPSEQAGMTLRPSRAKSYIEREFDRYGEESYINRQADGLAAARSARQDAAAVTLAAELAEAQARDNVARLRQAEADRDHAHRWLGHFARRPKHGHALYYLFLALLGLGDAVAVTGASLMWGEPWVLAIGQGLASGAAAVAAGWVGGDVRHRRDAVARAQLAAEGELSSEVCERYPALFAPVPDERDTYRLALTIALLVVVCLGSAIFALRAAVEGSLLAGVIFGGLAVATCLASFVNAWVHADRIADLLERYDGATRHTERQHVRLAQAPAPAQRNRAVAEADSIEREHRLRGEAVREGVLALAEGVMRRHPEIFGHAIAPEQPSDPVGRRWLRPEESNGKTPLRIVPNATTSDDPTSA